MSSYCEFAFFYDGLTTNISYQQRAAYFDAIIQRFGVKDKILLDLACGTGSLSEEFTKFGYDVIGVDASSEMLSVAMDKKYESGSDIVYLCQTMQELDLYGTVDSVVCALDSLNHITDINELKKAFDRVSLFLIQGGVFVFDVNTIYKHKKILSGNTFVYENDSVFCVWQNSECNEENIVEITIDLFERNENANQYQRHEEYFLERAYSHEQICAIVAQAGLELVAIYDEDSIEPMHDQSQRLVYVTKKR